MQKKLPSINSAHGSETRNIINELIKLFNSMGYTYDEALQKAHDVLNEAKQTNDMNKDVQKQVNDLILHAGESDAEVIQARGNHTVLNERLKDVDKRLAEMPIKPLKYGPLEMPSDFKPDLLCTFYRDNDGIIKHNMNFNERYKNGTQLYVRSNGNDSTADGSTASPYRTISKAIADAVAGTDSKYEIITNIPVLNGSDFSFNQTVENKTIAFVSEGTYEESAKQSRIYSLNPSDYNDDWDTGVAGWVRTMTEGAKFTKTVVGTSISFKYRTDTSGGIFKVKVDGREDSVKEYSSYSITNDIVEKNIFFDLGSGNHTVEITFVGADPLNPGGVVPRILIHQAEAFSTFYYDYSKVPKYAKDKTLVSSNREYVWTQDGTGTFRTDRTGARNVIDTHNVDIYGVPIPLVNASSLSVCKSTKNTWYSDGTTVWVHRNDNRRPTMDDTILNIGVNGINPTLGNGGVLYFENFILTNWQTAHPFTATNTASTPQGEVCLNDVILVGGINNASRGNALSIEGIKDVYSFNVIAAYAQLDGFNYHYTNIAEANKRDCLAVEYNCKAYNLGLEFQGAGSNNASTSHEGASILRVGTVGYRNTGATIIDVNGCYSVLYDCNASQPMLDGIKGKGRAYSFTTESSGREGKTYLINCGATEADTSLVIDTTHKAYIQNFKYDGEVVASGEIELL